MPLYIAGIPEDELAELKEKTKEMKIQGFDLANHIRRLTPEQVRATGYKSAEHVIEMTAADITRLVESLERKYPS